MKTTISASVDMDIAQLLEKKGKKKSVFVNKLLRSALTNEVEAPVEQDRLNKMEENLIMTGNERETAQAQKDSLKDEHYWGIVMYWKEEIRKSRCKIAKEYNPEPIEQSAGKLGVSYIELCNDIDTYVHTPTPEE